MFDNLITPCILSPLTSSDQHMLSPFVYMLESISTGNELISLSAVILVHTCTTCTSCSFYHTGLPHLTATFTLGTHWVCSGYPSTHWVPLPEFRVRFGISPTWSRPLCTPSTFTIKTTVHTLWCTPCAHPVPKKIEIWAIEKLVNNPFN